MTKVTVDREVLHQLARRALHSLTPYSPGPEKLGTAMNDSVLRAAEKIRDATAAKRVGSEATIEA